MSEPTHLIYENYSHELERIADAATAKLGLCPEQRNALITSAEIGGLFFDIEHSIRTNEKENNIETGRDALADALSDLGNHISSNQLIDAVQEPLSALIKAELRKEAELAAELQRIAQEKAAEVVEPPLTDAEGLSAHMLSYLPMLPPEREAPPPELAAMAAQQRIVAAPSPTPSKPKLAFSHPQIEGLRNDGTMKALVGAVINAAKLPKEERQTEELARAQTAMAQVLTKLLPNGPDTSQQVAEMVEKGLNLASGDFFRDNAKLTGFSPDALAQAMRESGGSKGV